MSLPSKLGAILATGDIPADLEIVYDDRHGLWGGTRIVISDSFGEKRCERAGGGPNPEVFSVRVPRGELLELLGLLVKMEAWEQRVPERPPVPDEVRATLLITVSGQESVIWERTHDMARNQRLDRIKVKMCEMLTA